MKKLYFTFALFVTACTCLWAQDVEPSTFSVATYNVDGLPKEVLGININPDGPGGTYSVAISQRLEESGWNIIGLNEDFNYHDSIIGSMKSYDFQTYTDSIYATPEAVIGALLKTWRFDCDGLELATTKGYKVANETIVPWIDEAVYGYYDHDNDSLTKKGFRYYTVTTPNDYDIDIIILHADACDELEDVKAREYGMEQLYDFIRNITTNNPLIAMGDYNCRYATDRLQELFIDKVSALPGCSMEDACRQMEAVEDLDKILYMNRDDAAYRIKPIAARRVENFVKEDGTQLADHYPMCATFAIEENRQEGTAITSVYDDSKTTIHKYIDNGKIIIMKNNHRYAVSGQQME